MTTASSLCFLSKYTVLLQGDNKEYIQVFFSLVARITTWALSIYFICIHASILVVYATNVLNVFVNLIMVALYERRHYPFVKYKGIYNREYIKGTGDVLFQKIANTIFTSTDLILISVFMNLSFASVYNLYFQVFKSVLTLLVAIVQAPFNSFGKLYNEENNHEKFCEIFSTYQHLIIILSSIVLTITGTLIIPFIKIYARNFVDFNYIYPSMVLLFFSQIFSQIINRPFGTVLNVSGNFKMQNVQCGLAAIINILVSVSFIDYIGINSIILCSFVGTLIILFMNIYQAYKHVLYSSPREVVKNIVVNYLMSLIMIVTSLKLEIECTNFFHFLLCCIIDGIIVSLTLVITNMIFANGATTNLFMFIKNIWLTHKKTK